MVHLVGEDVRWRRWLAASMTWLWRRAPMARSSTAAGQRGGGSVWLPESRRCSRGATQEPEDGAVFKKKARQSRRCDDGESPRRRRLVASGKARSGSARREKIVERERVDCDLSCHVKTVLETIYL
ncbi:hypothetical protein M6B38_139865 [Iris pallida]|uniref:Uncharacterized protein n=1 Tax=Iris pallida TaxID=29817 RepID=A0AAX6FD41_IRIPA|nr:hypothetical protein M6B38_139865 [Iris pallida]